MRKSYPCYYCQQVGHLWVQCPKRAEENPSWKPSKEGKVHSGQGLGGSFQTRGGSGPEGNSSGGAGQASPTWSH
jgi:hypothetical protein